MRVCLCLRSLPPSNVSPRPLTPPLSLNIFGPGYTTTMFVRFLVNQASLEGVVAAPPTVDLFATLQMWFR